MAGFNDTIELERSLLSLMLKSKMLVKKMANKLKPFLFTSRERKFISENITKTLRDTGGVLTKNIFDYEVRSRIEDTEAHYYEGEWTLIVGITSADDAEVLLDRLMKANVGRQLLDVAEDMVESVEKGAIDEALSQLRNAIVKLADKKKAPPVVELTDYRERLELIHDKKLHPEKYLGIKTGFQTFDKHTGGLFSKEFTLFSCITGTGKSTVLRQIESGVVLCNESKNVLHICNEEHSLQVLTKFDAQLTRIPYLDFKLATITEEALEDWKKKMEIAMKKDGVGRIFVKEVPAYSDVTLIEDTLNELANRGIKIHVVIIDHLPHVKPIGQAWGEYDEQGKAAAECWELARSYDVALVSATQAATVVEEKQTKGRRAGKLDVYGSKEQVHVANTSIAITVLGKDETQTEREEWERDVFWLCDVKKNRDGPPFTFKARHHVRYGFVEEVFDKGPQADAALQKAEDEANAATGKKDDEHEEPAQEAPPQETKPVESKPSVEPEVRPEDEYSEPQTVRTPAEEEALRLAEDEAVSSIKPLEDFPQVGYCGDCGLPVYETQSGTVCKNGHGGAPVLDTPPAQETTQEVTEPPVETPKPVSPAGGSIASGWLARKKTHSG